MNQRLEACTKELAENKACGIAPYLTAGDGGLERTRELLMAMERAGASCVELGVPFSDPIADGPVLQAAAQRALAGGTTLAGILECVTRYRSDGGQLPIALFSYANPLLGLGSGDLENAWREACGRIAAAGLDGVLVPDLPIEEGAALRQAAGENGLCPIFFVSPTTSEERLARAAEWSRGFLYAIGRTGITGGKTALGPETRAFLDRVSEASAVPVGVGFGLRDADQVRAVADHAQLAIVGSALVAHIHEAASASPDRAHENAVTAAEQFVTDLKRGTLR